MASMVIHRPHGESFSLSRGEIGDRKKCTETEKCTKRLVRIVKKNVKCPLNHLKIDRYTVRNAIRNTDHREDFSFFVI